jgi:hypothetical protein
VPRPVLVLAFAEDQLCIFIGFLASCRLPRPSWSFPGASNDVLPHEDGGARCAHHRPWPAARRSGAVRFRVRAGVAVRGRPVLRGGAVAQRRARGAWHQRRSACRFDGRRQVRPPRRGSCAHVGRSKGASAHRSRLSASRHYPARSTVRASASPKRRDRVISRAFRRDPAPPAPRVAANCRASSDRPCGSALAHSRPRGSALAHSRRFRFCSEAVQQGSTCGRRRRRGHPYCSRCGSLAGRGRVPPRGHDGCRHDTRHSTPRSCNRGEPYSSSSAR